MKFRAAVLALILTVFGLGFPISAFAGGGLVSFDIPWSGHPLNPGEEYVVRPTVRQNDGNFCKNCPIKIKLEDPKSDDLINPSSDKTDENGTMYAKVVSKTAGNRIIFAEVTLPDGSIYISSKAILNYSSGQSTPSIYPDSGKPISGDLVVTVSSQNLLNDPSYKGKPREVFIKWNDLLGADYYEVYLRPSGYENWAMPQDGVTREKSSKIILSAEYDYYVKIQGCNSSECRNSNELFVAKMSADKLFTPNPSITPLLGDKKVEELNKKVEKLEDELSKTQKKQSLLEEKFNQLLKWLKSIFPFFK